MTPEAWSLGATPRSVLRASGMPRTTVAQLASPACLWTRDRRHSTQTHRLQRHDGNHLQPPAAVQTPPKPANPRNIT
jgi:hypothetical protein